MLATPTIHRCLLFTRVGMNDCLLPCRIDEEYLRPLREECHPPEKVASRHRDSDRMACGCRCESRLSRVPSGTTLAQNDRNPSRFSSVWWLMGPPLSRR